MSASNAALSSGRASRSWRVRGRIIPIASGVDVTRGLVAGSAGYVGRVGALAVALGVGAAIASMPAASPKTFHAPESRPTRRPVPLVLKQGNEQLRSPVRSDSRRPPARPATLAS